MIKFLDEALLILAPGVRWRITGEQIYENIVWLDSVESIPTKIDVEAKAKELQDEYDKKQYARNRANEYPTIQEQLDTLYHGGLAEWKATIKAVKDKYPKPE